MFKTGEYVVYGYSGVCLVEDLTEMETPGTGEMSTYYVLSPIKTRASKVFAPVESKKPIRAVMTREEAEAFLDSIAEIEPLEITSDKHREEEYKRVMKTCDCREWIRIIKTLYNRREERLDRGKQITAMDSRYWKSAEEYLYSELSISLDLDYDQVGEFLKSRLDGK